jgi:phospholipase/lecithinase/hemolysin
MITTRARFQSVLVVCLALLLAGAQGGAAQSRFSGVVVFGTSLSDPGNAFALVGAQATPHDFTLDPLLVPAAPYARGGHHFSNGATWIEQYARTIGLGDSVTAALATDDPVATNFAVGAARAYNDGKNFNLGRQVDTFLVRSGGVARTDALYVIEMGGNDARDAFAVYAVGGNGGLILQAALTSIVFNIQRLYAAGARDFLVWSAPNIALTPALRQLGAPAQGLAMQVTEAFNAGLTQALAQLSLALPGVTFARLDAYTLLGDIVAAPESYGLTNADAACVTTVAPFHCRQPGDFLFWDGIHPTKSGHRILAEHTAHVLQ